MTSKALFQNPQDYLLLELEKRQARNASYSLRAFSRDLGLAPSTLSEVLKGRYGLSNSTAEAVALRIGLDSDQTRHFIDLFTRRFAKKRTVRRAASRSIRQRNAHIYRSIAVDAFRAVSDWYHMAILEWIVVVGGKSKKTKNSIKNLRALSEKLGITLNEVKEALARLERLGQVKLIENEWHLCEDFTAASSESIPSEAIRRFHRQILERALASLDSVENSQREISSTVFAFPRSRLQEAKKALKDFRREFAERFGTGTGHDSVYCLGMQFFPLITIDSKNGNSDDED